ncbi:MAG: hypothetical protein M1812_003177 [Candelaria pacifica]|nr:MAG: hypothetical protein M1812_003177 [Candelaria pacifica]
MSTAGPELPPHLVSKRKRQAATDEKDSPARSSSPSSRSSSNESAGKRQRIVGPSLPPAPLAELPHLKSDRQDTDSSEDDDDFGPALPSGQGQTSEYHTQAARCAALEDEERDEAAKKPKREEWMLVPPKHDDWSSKVDSTKLRNRKFNTGKGSKAPTQKSEGENALWTETPEQKRQRLEDEVLGIKKPATMGAEDKRAMKDGAGSEETSRRIAEYNEKNRGKSLIEDHKKAVPKEKEDDPSKRAFDKEKDMGLGRKIGHAQRKELLSRASDFGSRFAGGSYL